MLMNLDWDIGGLYLWRNLASARVFGRHIIADWKPILFLVQGSKPNIAGDYFRHGTIESKPPNKSLNDWSKVR